MLAALALMAATPLTGQFVDYKWRNDVSPGWERFTMALTNEGGATETLRVCPVDVQMVLFRPGRPHRNSFAVAFDDANWRFDCDERDLAPGESTEVKFYFRQTGMWGLSREIKITTNLGKFVLGRGRLGKTRRSTGYSVTTAG